MHYIWVEYAFLLYHRLGFCLVEAGRVEDSTFMENTMQAHWRWAQLGAGHIKWKVRRRRTSASVKSLSITKFLFEAPIAFSVRTKLRTSPRFLHGLNDWNRFFEPLTSSMFPRTLMRHYQLQTKRRKILRLFMANKLSINALLTSYSRQPLQSFSGYLI